MTLSDAELVLQTEARAITALIDRLDERFEEAVGIVQGCKGRVICTGMGKSGFVARKLAATLSSLGTPAFFLDPPDALHGSLGVAVPGDVAIAMSNGGSTREVLKIVEAFRRLEIPVVALCGKADSPLALNANVFLDVSVDEEACHLSLAPTTSTTAALAMSDALAIVVSKRKGYEREDFAKVHPGGGLGNQLATLGDLMHAGQELPTVTESATFSEVVSEISEKRLGLTAVVSEDGRLVGLITDGDLRRAYTNYEDLAPTTARQLMSAQPLTLNATELASVALPLMERQRITAVLVTDDSDQLVGVVHLHDLWGLQLL